MHTGNDIVTSDLMRGPDSGFLLLQCFCRNDGEDAGHRESSELFNSDGRMGIILWQRLYLAPSWLGSIAWDHDIKRVRVRWIFVDGTF